LCLEFTCATPALLMILNRSCITLIAMIHLGFFKGTCTLIQEHCAHGTPLPDAKTLKAASKGFKCLPRATDCSCWQVIYTQPDFTNVPSLLREHCTQCNVHMLFLPWYHCELNFIEQVWGYAMRLYCMYPSSSDITDLENNIIESLDSALLDCTSI
jgi:hypothetical protein